MEPLEYMLKVMRDPREPMERRVAMARAALPYCHKKLKPVAATPEQLKATAELLSSIRGYPVSVTPARRKRRR